MPEPPPPPPQIHPCLFWPPSMYLYIQDCNLGHTWAKKLSHTHLIKTTPHFITVLCPSKHSNKCKTSSCTTACLDSGFITRLELTTTTTKLFAM